MRTSRIAVLLAAGMFCGVGGSGAGQAQTSRVASGDLLIEMDKLGQGDGQAGIYAWRSPMPVYRAVIHGRRPRWSPDHTQFVFWRDGAPWCQELGGGPARLLHLSPANIDAALEWWPDGSAFVYKAWFPRGHHTPGISLFPARSSGARDSLCLPLYDQEQAEYVGRWSVNHSCGQVAYERLRVVDGVGCLDSEVRLVAVDGQNPQRLSHTALAGCLTSNPLWQPRGRLLAFEAVQLASLKRHTFVLDLVDGSLRQVGQHGLRPVPDWQAPDTSRLYAWSPAGDELLVQLDYGAGGGQLPVVPSRGMLHVVSLTPGREPLFLGGAVGRIPRAVWSPDGQRVAWIVTRGAELWASAYQRLSVWTRGVGTNDGDTSEVGVPAGLQAVDLDW